MSEINKFDPGFLRRNFANQSFVRFIFAQNSDVQALWC